jgi:hypothetical protein
LRSFAADAGLAFVEVIFAPVREHLSVIAVEPRPNIGHFDAGGRLSIFEALADLLTGPVQQPSVSSLAAAVS